MFRSSAALALVLTSLVAGCSDTATVPEDKGFGASPTLPAPRESFIPTVNIATAGTWPEGDKPKAAPGLAVNAFADGLQHPRTILSLPNGDVLVAESDAPPKPDDAKGIRGWVMTKVMAKAGSGKPSADRISILRDADKDGVAELRQPFIETISSPFGMALAGSVLYVAATDALWRFPYREGDLKPAGAGVKVADLPAGTINHHWTKDLTVSPDGRKLYVSVGSNSNAAENGIEAEARRAGILEIDAETGASRVFASGLRNPNGLTWQPQSGALWTVVNERDELGSDLVPDYMTAVQEGGFYGWPYSYFGQHVDTRVTPQRPDLVAKALVPDYALGAHTASLGLTFYTADLLPEKYRNGAFVGQHGSWNRKPRSGYKVIFVPFTDGRPSGAPEDILSGFVTEEGTAKGRPVGVATAKDGALLVADDVGNRIWRVTPAR